MLPVAEFGEKYQHNFCASGEQRLSRRVTGMIYF